MKFVNLKVEAPKEQLLTLIRDNERVNKNVRFDEKLGKPNMKVKEKDGRVKVTCELLGRATKDNGFLVGSFFWGKIKEKNGTSSLRGIILTAPLYHLILCILFVAFIIQCFRLRGLSVVPIFMVLLDIMMFKTEFKKQGYIQRYLYRAASRINE